MPPGPNICAHYKCVCECKGWRREDGKFSGKINLCHVAPPEALHALVPHALMGKTKAARNSQVRKKSSPTGEDWDWDADGDGVVFVVVRRVLVAVPQRKSFVCHEIVLSASWSIRAIAPPPSPRRPHFASR